MATTIRIVSQKIDSNGKIISENIVYNKKATFPKTIKELGYNHEEQISILKSTQDCFLETQTEIINSDNGICPNCKKKARKQGKFSSAFHAIFTDHEITLQRKTCVCGWKNNFSIQNMYGNSLHPDLVEMQSITGANNSFRQAAKILNKQSFFNRAINNNDRIQRTITQVGQALSELKKDDSWATGTTQAKELIINVDGGHVKSNSMEKRSFEIIIANVYNPKNLIAKDKNHNIITNKTCVASARSDKLSSIKKLANNACYNQGMAKNTKITALSDGAKNCWSVIDNVTSACEKVTKILDWFHIGKKFKNTEHVIPKEHAKVFESSKWNLWHGKIEESLSCLEFLKNSLDLPGSKKIKSLSKYISNNRKYIVNYGKRKNKELVYTSNVAEASVNSIINIRQKQDQKMQWSREGAHCIVQIRTSVFSCHSSFYWSTFSSLYRSTLMACFSGSNSFSKSKY